MRPSPGTAPAMVETNVPVFAWRERESTTLLLSALKSSPLAVRPPPPNLNVLASRRSTSQTLG